MSEKWDQRQRQQFLEIAARAKNEVCASYTVVSLGLQAFRNNRRLIAAAAAAAAASGGAEAATDSAGVALAGCDPMTMV